MTEKKTFDRVLAKCLEELARGDDVAAIVRRYPEHQDRLRPLLETARAAKVTLSDAPEPPNGLATGRERVLRAAEARRAWMRPPTSQSQSRARPQSRLRFPASFNLSWAWKLVGVMLVVMMLSVSMSGQIVWAASESLPRHPLYPLKITGWFINRLTL